MGVEGLMWKKRIGNSVKQLMNGSKKNLIEIKSILNGWQLRSFEESYKNKVENGISLFKKEILK